MSVEGGRKGKIVLLGANGEFKEYASKHLNAAAYREHVIDLLDEGSKLEPILSNAIVIASISARPTYKKSPIIFWTKVLLGRALGGDVNEMLNKAPLEYQEGQAPEKINWLGLKNIIDNSKGAKHVILISSMLGSYENNFLNKWGGGRNILLWKRKSEIYLKNSQTPYTIIHPPKLVSKAKPLKIGDFFLGVNDLRDKFPPSQEDPSVPPDHLLFNLKISRVDLAYFITECVENLDLVKNKSFDIVRRKDINLPSLKTNSLNALVDELRDKEYDYSYPKHYVLDNE